MPRYIYDPETKEMVCIDTRNGKLRPPVFMPKDSMQQGHFFENLGVHIQDKDHKREVLRAKNVVEAG